MSVLGVGASQESDWGVAGREGKYVSRRRERKLGESGSRGGGEEREVCGYWERSREGVDDAGRRSGGEFRGGASGSEIWGAAAKDTFLTKGC